MSNYTPPQIRALTTNQMFFRADEEQEAWFQTHCRAGESMYAVIDTRFNSQVMMYVVTFEAARDLVRVFKAARMWQPGWKFKFISKRTAF